MYNKTLSCGSLLELRIIRALRGISYGIVGIGRSSSSFCCFAFPLELHSYSKMFILGEIYAIYKLTNANVDNNIALPFPLLSKTPISIYPKARLAYIINYRNYIVYA